MDDRIYICPLRDLAFHTRNLRASHVISMLGVEGEADRPPGILAKDHLRMQIDDIAQDIPGYVRPNEEHAIDLIAFARRWDRSAPLIIHCYAGISRSTAAALIILGLFNPGREAEAARLLRERAPHAKPNRLLIAAADRYMRWDGRMVAAVTAMGPSDPSRQGLLVGLPAILPVSKNRNDPV